MDEFETTCEMEQLASSPLPSRRSSSLRAALKERANKIVQTTARHSWSLMRQLKGTHRARGDDDDARGEDGEGGGEEDERKRPHEERRTRDGETWNDQFNSVPRKLARYFRSDRRRTLTLLTLLTAFPPVLRASVEVSGTRILDYMVTTITSLVVLLSMSSYSWGKEVYPAMKMLLFATLVVVQLLAENVCVALITHLDENKFAYTSLQDNLYLWLSRGCETSRAFSELFCGRFPGWTTLHFGAWVILGVLAPTLGAGGGKGKGLVGTILKKNNGQKAVSRDERPINGNTSHSSKNRDEEQGENQGKFEENNDNSPNIAFPVDEQKTSSISSSPMDERRVFAIAARTCATIALARAIRVVSFMLTVVPNPKPGCYNRQFSDAPASYEDGWHLIEYGSSRIRGSGGCNDLIFSGHGVIYMSGFLCVATHGISLGSFVVFLAMLHMSCKETLDQTHYGVDMFLAIAVTALSWRECHTVEKWVTGKLNDDKGGRDATEEENSRGKLRLSGRATRAVSFCLPFFIIALVIAGATVFITSDA